MNSTRPYISTAFSILALLVIVYSLVYSGRFIIDDEHILAARTISLAFDDHVNNTRVIGNSRVFALSQLPIAAMNIEPAQTVLGVPFVKLASLLNVGQVQALFLMNIWITALTAVILFLTVIIHGYSKAVALVVSFLFGLCTIAFPYSRTFFRDPLAMFFLVCAWMFAAAILKLPYQNGNHPKRSLFWMGLIISLAAGVLTKNTILIALPVILLELLIGDCHGNLLSGIKKLVKRSWKTWALIIAGLSSFGLFWFQVVPSIPSLARFTPAYYGYLLQFFFTTPHPHLLEALSGPFISPGKSIFIFSPVLLLAIWSLIFRFRASWSAWLYLILLIVFQALFYDMDWSGHINWGLRYLLPTVPLLMLSLAPLIQRLLTSINGKIGLISIAIISFLIQLLGILPPITKYFEEMLTSTPPVSESSLVWGVKNPILIWCMNWIFGGKPLDIALERMGGITLVILPISLLTMILVFLSLWRYKYHKLAYVAVIANISLSMLMLFLYMNDPIYMKDRMDYQESRRMLTREYQPGDTVLIKSYGSPIWDYWMNWPDPKIQWTSLPYYFPAPSLIEKYSVSNDPEDALDTISMAILNQSIQPGKRIWLVNASDSPGASLEIEKRWLVNRSSTSSCSVSQSSRGNIELCLFMIK